MREEEHSEATTVCLVEKNLGGLEERRPQNRKFPGSSAPNGSVLRGRRTVCVAPELER